MLIHAAGKGYVNVVKELLELGVDVSCKQREPNPIFVQALMLAIEKGKLEIVTLLLEQNGIKLLVFHAAQDPIRWALLNGHPDIVTAITAHTKIYQTSKELAKELFFIAIEKNLPNLVTFLLEKGVDVNEPEALYYHKTALIEACKNQSIDMIKLLLDIESIDVDVRDESSYNAPLHYAAQLGNVDIIKQLLSLGAHVNAYNGKRRNALDVAFEYRKYEAFCLLLKDTALSDKEKLSFLRWAVETKNVPILHSLLDREDFNIEQVYNSNPKGKPYLLLLAEENMLDKNLVQKLIAKGIKTCRNAIPEIAAIFKLVEHIQSIQSSQTRESSPYKKSLKMFGHQLVNFDHEIEQEKIAANAMLNVFLKKCPIDTLKPYKTILQEGRLKDIYAVCCDLYLKESDDLLNSLEPEALQEPLRMILGTSSSL
jgi:hypothetical protein